MTNEKLYALATENLRTLCWGYAKEYSMGPGEDFFESVKKNPDFFSRYYPALAAAIEIWATAKGDVLKSKGGTAYSAIKRMLKRIPEHNTRLRGTWVDKEGASASVMATTLFV